MKNTNKLLVVIIIFAFFLRLYKLNNLPYFIDEVSIGLSAYIFSQSGTDYYGNPFPTSFQSSADWHTPLYVYSVYLLNDIRLPAVLLGTFAVFIFYKLVSELFQSPKLALLSSFALAINPWAIHYSRIGIEVAGMLPCLLSGWYFSLKKRPYLSIFCFVLSAYFYSTARLFILFLIPIFILSEKPNLQKVTKYFFFFLLLCLPLLKDIFNGHAGHRFSYTNIFSNPVVPTETNQNRNSYNIQKYGLTVGTSPDLVSKLLFNKFTYISNTFINNYFSAFSADFLFTKGDQNPRHTPALSLFYLTDFFLISLGLLSKFKHKKTTLLWLALSPIPFSLTRDSTGPHATRLLLMLPPLLVLISAGLNQILNKKYLYPILASYPILLFFWWQKYIYLYPYQSPRSWSYGLHEIISTATKYDNKKVFITNSYDPVLLYFLYYNRSLLPSNFSLERNLPWQTAIPGFTGRIFQNYHIGDFTWGDFKNNKKLYQNGIFILNASDLIKLKENQITYTILNQQEFDNKEIPSIYTVEIN